MGRSAAELIRAAVSEYPRTRAPRTLPSSLGMARSEGDGRLSERAEELRPASGCLFRADVGAGLFAVEWDGPADLPRALELGEVFGDLDLGLVDAVVMATAERLEARAIATLDLRDLGAVELRGSPELWPRDLPS